MRSLLLTLAICSVFVCLSWSIDKEDLTDHYSTLYEKAVQNIGRLPFDKETEYLGLLEEYPDVFMAFFFASEEASKLLLAERDVILSHHKAVKDLWESNEGNYSLPFFLSYIAKITVTDERITPYRKLFKEYGLHDLLLGYTDVEELVRELNLWTRRYMTFQPTSGRDMAPFDVIKRTNLGRCEEMQIFFISAARTLGIPARPAMTPLWAHTDNNHAWVEVFADGRWRYLGAVEPAYDLDDAWFSANAARAVMIMSSAAFPDTSDIILSEGMYDSTINSTPNYDSEHIKSRTVKITSGNVNGEIIPHAEISVTVYNWGMLRPIYRTQTDVEGQLELVTGAGSFIIAAKKDSTFVLHEVPFHHDNWAADVILGNNREISFDTILEYPDPQLPNRVERPEWNEYRRSFTEDYNSIVSAYQESSFPYEPADSLIKEIWSRCRNNKDNFLIFYEQNRDLPEKFLSLLNKMDEKFLWQAEPHQFKNIYDFFSEMKDLPYSEDILVNIISPTVLFEELPNEPIDRNLVKWREGNKEERITSIVEYVKANYEIEDDRAVLSLLPYDHAMNLSFLTDYQHKMLVCSILRANHIPASYTRLPSIINIYLTSEEIHETQDGDHLGYWRYYDLDKKAFLLPENGVEQSTLTAVTITTVDEQNYPIMLANEQYALTFMQDGLFYPSDRQPETDNEGRLRVALEPGSYQLQIGYRISNELTGFYLEAIEIEKESEIERTIVLKQYPKIWEKITTDLSELLEDLSLHERAVNSYFVILGDYDSEPVRRVADRLYRQAEERGIVWIGTRPAADSPEYYQISSEYEMWLEENAVMKGRVLTLLYDANQDNWSFFDGYWDTLPD